MIALEESAYKGAKVLRSFEQLEAMPPEVRECVYEFGQPIVTACLFAGVSDPAQIRELVRVIWDGPRSMHQRHDRSRGPMAGTLDWLLVNSGSSLNSLTLARALYSNSLAILPMEPTQAMVGASMDAVKFMDRVTKEQKHRNRLRDAIRAGVMHVWPKLREVR